MYEKVNMYHPDKVADRIAGAVVDLAYRKNWRDRVACEVLIGHGTATVMVETTSDAITEDAINAVVNRILGTDYYDVIAIVKPQDAYLSANQEHAVHCGDNGIFKGMPLTSEQALLSMIARDITREVPFDGKYIYDSRYGGKLIVCQSNCDGEKLRKSIRDWNYFEASIYCNPIGDWFGGIDVDAGCTNRKLGSDMGDAVTGGGLHGKDLSKADVSVNIYCHLRAQLLGKPVSAVCAIGDDRVLVEDEFISYEHIVKVAKHYIDSVGGFEKFAEWGLI